MFRIAGRNPVFQHTRQASLSQSCCPTSPHAAQIHHTDLSFTSLLHHFTSLLQLGGKLAQGNGIERNQGCSREGRVKFSVGSAPCLAAWEAGITQGSRENKTAFKQLQAPRELGEPAGRSGDETCCARATPQRHCSAWGVYKAHV